MSKPDGLHYYRTPQVELTENGVYIDGGAAVFADGGCDSYRGPFRKHISSLTAQQIEDDSRPIINETKKKPEEMSWVEAADTVRGMGLIQRKSCNPEEVSWTETVEAVRAMKLVEKEKLQREALKKQEQANKEKIRKEQANKDKPRKDKPSKDKETKKAKAELIKEEPKPKLIGDRDKAMFRDILRMFGGGDRPDSGGRSH